MDAFLKNNISLVAGEVNQQTRIVINNVLTFLSELKEDPQKLEELNFQKPRDLTASICGVSLRTVVRIKQECKDGGEASIHRKNDKQNRPVTDIDDFNKSVIKQIVSSFYSQGEYPCVQKIVDVAKERIDGFKCSNTSMRRILKVLGYKFKTAPDGRKQLLERRDIVCARLTFLRKLDDLKKSGDKRPRIYLDETWVNQNHSRKRVWVDYNDEGGLNKNIGKGGRLIVCHAGCAVYGFIPEAEWIFRAMSSKHEDYHTEMNAEGFTEWFTNLLKNLEEPSVIIMDNASYHSKQINNGL